MAAAVPRVSVRRDLETFGLIDPVEPEAPGGQAAIGVVPCQQCIFPPRAGLKFDSNRT
jgi:hypothetical protein